MYQFDHKSVYLGEREQFLVDFSSQPKLGKGQLYLAIDLPDNPGAEDSVADRLWRALNDRYYNSETDDAFLRFEESLKAVNDALFAESKKRESGSLGRINSLALVFDGRTLHFASTGLAEIHLLRKGHLSLISDAAKEDPQTQFLEIASGELIGDDRLVVSTRGLPMDTELVTEAVQTESKRLLNRLRVFGKEQGLAGVLSVFTMQSTSGPHEEPDQDEEIEGSEGGTDVTDTLSTPVPPSSARRGFSTVLKERLRSVPFQELHLAAKRSAHRMGECVSSFVRKPSIIRGIDRRYVMAGVVALLIVFAFLVALQSNIRGEQQVAETYQLMMKDVRSKISIAEKRFLIGEKTDALEFLNDSSQLIQQVELAGYFKNEVNQLKEEVATLRDTFDSIVRISQPFVLADLSVKGPVDALGIIHTKDEKNYVYELHRLYETILEKVQDPLVIDQEAVVIAGWDFEDNNSLVFITQDGRVVEYRDGRFEFVDTADSTWKKSIDIKTYSRFVYVLDPSEGKIWKYPRLRTRYGNAVEYNSQGDLREAVSIAIDGNVYALMRDGTIQKFNKGELQPFEIKDQPRSPLQNPTRLFTHTEAKNLYVLDSTNTRVVVYSKDINGVSRYQKQFVFEGVQAGELRDLYVDSSEQKLYVLTGKSILLTDL